MMMMVSNSISGGLNDPKFANWNNAFNNTLKKREGLGQFKTFYTTLLNNWSGGNSLSSGITGTQTDKDANEIRWTYQKPADEALVKIDKLKAAFQDMSDGTVDDANNQKLLEEAHLTQYKDTKFSKEDIKKIAETSLNAWKQVEEKLANQVVIDPDRSNVKQSVQGLINVKEKLLKDLQYGTDGQAPVISVATDAKGNKSITPLYDDKVIDPNTALKVTRLQQLISNLAPYEEALKAPNQDAAIDALLKPKQEAFHAFAEKLKTTKDSDHYRNHQDWWRWNKSTWFYGKDIDAKAFDEIFEQNLGDIQQIYASITGASVDASGNVVGGFIKPGKESSVTNKQANFTLDQLEELSLGRNGKPIVVEPFKDTTNYAVGPEVASADGSTAKVWLPKNETVEASNGVTFNGLPVVITKTAEGKLLARITEVTKAGNGVSITQMPIALDPQKAKNSDGGYKSVITQADLLPPEKGQSIRLFTYAFNSQGEPTGNVIMTPSPSGIPTKFNDLPNIIKAKMTASSYADPITFPPESTLPSVQSPNNNNEDLSLLTGGGTIGVTTVPNTTANPQVVTPTAVTVQQQATGSNTTVQQQPVLQQQGIPQAIVPPQLIYPATPLQQPNTTFSTPVPQPVQPLPQTNVVAPATTSTTTPAPRRTLIAPDLYQYTTTMLTQ
jgi:hypothetical protein